MARHDVEAGAFGRDATLRIFAGEKTGAEWTIGDDTDLLVGLLAMVLTAGWYLALVSLGYTVKAPGAGGSYGYGKAGLIGASSTRTVIAYTCFKEREDDLGVTRRLLGMTYWGQHDVGGRSFTGFARLGREDDDAV